MPQTDLYYGYNMDFLSHTVALPRLSNRQLTDVAPVTGTDDGIARYVNYSLQMSSKRGFPYFTATNIDGGAFRKATRKDNWRVDRRIDAEHQWGPELYGAKKSDFDRGHMTKREDVQWGDTPAIARWAADSTFYYSNAVPQHASLNQEIWRSLEDYILHTEAKNGKLRISVFTGPVLGKNDPYFVTEVKGKNIRLPYLFWKVVLFEKSDGKLYRVGFLMSQHTLLFSNGIVMEDILEGGELEGEEELFMEFQDADTYQVSISTIEKLSGITMPEAAEIFKDARKIKLILEEVDIQESFKESSNIFGQIGFRIGGIQL